MAWIIRAIDVRQLARNVEHQKQTLEQRAADLAKANQALLNEIAQHQQTERRLRESETRFRLLVEQVKDYAIFMIDLEGRVVSWNAGAQMLKGYRAEEIMGQPLSRFYTAEDIQRDRPGQLLKLAAEQGRIEDEGWRVRKDGSRFWANVVLTALHDDAGRLYGYTKVTRDMTERRQSQPYLESESFLQEKRRQ
jgi:PAS domain S-box-containing protein